MKRLIVAALVTVPVLASASPKAMTQNERQFIMNVVPLGQFAKQAMQARTCGMRSPRWAADAVGHMAAIIYEMAQHRWSVELLQNLPADGKSAYISAMGEFSEQIARGNFINKTICLNLATEPDEMHILDSAARSGGWKG